MISQGMNNQVKWGTYHYLEKFKLNADTNSWESKRLKFLCFHSGQPWLQLSWGELLKLFTSK